MVYVERSGQEAVAYRDRVTGREVVQLTRSSEQSVIAGHDLCASNPTDGRIVFTGIPRPGAVEGYVYAMDRDGANITRLAHSHCVTPAAGALAQWSADGQRVYYRDGTNAAPLVGWVDLSTGDRGVFQGRLGRLSPTSHYGVYHTRCADYPDHVMRDAMDEHGIYVLDLETARVERIVSVSDCLPLHPRYREITAWHLHVNCAKWSPDGRLILLVLTNAGHYEAKYAERPHINDLYVVRADGTDLKRVGDFAGEPSWHPNGREILTCSPFGGRLGPSLVLHNVNTGRMRLASDLIGGHGHPSYSPDGRWLAVDHVLPGEGYGSINLVDFRHKRVVHATEVRARDHAWRGASLRPSWSYDSRVVLFTSDASGTTQLYLVAA